MQLADIANLATAIALVMASAFLLLITIRMKTPVANLKKGMARVRIATLLLGLFLLSHGIYHLSVFTGQPTNDDNLLYPISVALLVVFAFYVRARIFVPDPLKSKIVSSTETAFIRRNIGIILASGFALAISVYASIVFGNPIDVFDLDGILLSAALFTWMFIKNPSTDTLHFGFAMITIVWALAEIPYDLSDMGVINFGGIDAFGAWIHFLSMALIGGFVSYRAAKITFARPKDEPNSAEVLTLEHASR